MNTTFIDLQEVHDIKEVLKQKIDEFTTAKKGFASAAEDISKAWSGDAASIFVEKVQEKISELENRILLLNNFYDYLEDYRYNLNNIDYNSDFE